MQSSFGLQIVSVVLQKHYPHLCSFVYVLLNAPFIITYYMVQDIL
jgi:uncharacterized membrane-anchored protein YitT (DUF2179 family)